MNRVWLAWVLTFGLVVAVRPASAAPPATTGFEHRRALQRRGAFVFVWHQRPRASATRRSRRSTACPTAVRSRSAWQAAAMSFHSPGGGPQEGRPADRIGNGRRRHARGDSRPADEPTQAARAAPFSSRRSSGSRASCFDRGAFQGPADALASPGRGLRRARERSISREDRGGDQARRSQAEEARRRSGSTASDRQRSQDDARSRSQGCGRLLHEARD